MNFDCTKSMIWQRLNRNLLKLYGAKYVMKVQNQKIFKLQVRKLKNKNKIEQ